MKTRSLPPHLLGRQGEDIAQEYLKERGYRIVERGFRYARGEIDIIAYHRQTLVFVEVKTRLAPSHSLPEESITPAKARQIRRTAQAYMHRHFLEDIPCRFDVLALLFQGEQEFQIRHYRDAFD